MNQFLFNWFIVAEKTALFCKDDWDFIILDVMVHDENPDIIGHEH